jgi:predicted cupin superfamily sugar epimerase
MPKEAAMAKPWRCRIGEHRWQRLRNPEGGWYRECQSCGTQRDDNGGGNVFAEKRWPIN